MRILANENFPEAAVLALRNAGHDIILTRTDRPGSNDEDVLRRAQVKNRLLVTFDKEILERLLALNLARRGTSPGS